MINFSLVAVYKFILMSLFKPRNYGNITSDDGPAIPRYSMTSYGSSASTTFTKSDANPSHIMIPRKYNFERSLNFEDSTSPLEPELPIYSGSFLLQQQFNSVDDKSELFTSYSRKYAERKNEEANREGKPKIPVFSYRSRFDLFDGPSTFNSDPDSLDPPKRSANVTNYRNYAKEKKQPTVEPLIPIRRYQKEKKAYSLEGNQNISSNFDICKYGIAKPPSKEEEITRQNAEQFANKTKVNRVYPDILMADNIGGRSNKDDLSSFSSSSSPIADKSSSKNGNNKSGQFIPASSTYVPKGDQKPMFSQFKSDVFAKYAERKMNEQNNSAQREQANKYHLESDSDAFLFDSSPNSNDKSSNSKKSSSSNIGKEDQRYMTSFTSQQNQGMIPCKAKEDYERRKAQIDEEDLISQSDMEDTNSNNNNNLTSTKHIDDLLNSKEPDNIMARLEQFKKTMEESKKSTQYYGEVIARHNINVSDTPENQNSLLSESESADTSKIQDDMLSEPSLIFEINN